MEKSSFIQRGAWGPQILITLFVGAAACDDYNCADTATCTSTPNANQVEAGVDAGASTPRPSTTTGAPPVGTGENVEVTSDGERANGELTGLSDGSSSEQSSNAVTSETDRDAAITEDGPVNETSAALDITTSEPDLESGHEPTTSAPVEAEPLGSACEDDASCASGHCTDGVCCDAACDGVCSACDLPGKRGTCSATSADNACGELACPVSTECRTVQGITLEDNCLDTGECRTEAQCSVADVGQGTPCAGGEGECDGQGECVVPDKLALGRTCTNADECGSGYCAETASGGSVCCSSACEGTCQACGADGQCNKAPAHDDACTFACPSDTSCATYPDAPTNNCVGFGVCLAKAQFCTASYIQEGTACGASQECDGAGECSYVDRASPSVVSVNPVNGSTDVDRDVVIEVTLSEPIDEDSVGDAAKLYGPDGQVDVTVTLLDATTLVVSPNASLPLIAEHQLELTSALKDLAGNLLAGAPYRSSFTTRDGVWDTTPKLLETNNAMAASGPIVRADDAGNALVAWRMSGGGQDELWYARFDSSNGSWSNGKSVAGAVGYVTSLVTMANGNSRAMTTSLASPWAFSDFAYEAGADVWGDQASVANSVTSNVSGEMVRGQGDHVMVVWVQTSVSAPLQYSILSRSLVEGAWGPTKTVLAAQSDAVSYARVAVDNSGNAVCVWPRGTNVYRATLSNGAAVWSAPSSLDNGQTAGDVSVSVDSGGSFFAVWRRHDAAGLSEGTPVVRRLGSFGGNWSTATPLRSGTGYRTYDQAVQGDASGAAFAYWYGTTPEHPEHYVVNTAEYSPVSGTWEDVVAHSPSGNDADARFPELALDARGNGVLTWSQPDDGEYRHYVRRYIKGIGWGDIREFYAPTNPVSFNQNSSVAVAPDGEVTLVWTQNDGTRDNLWSLRFH